MNEKEINHVSKKNPVWKSMITLNNAMQNTDISYVSPIKPPTYELYKQHTVHLAREKLRRSKKSMSQTEPIDRFNKNRTEQSPSAIKPSVLRRDTPFAINNSKLLPRISTPNK